MYMGPTTMTLNSLAMQLPGAFGIDMSSPGGAQIGQFMLAMLKNSVIEPYLGIKPTDPIWNSVLYSNMTNYGIMMQNINATANARGMDSLMQMQAASKYKFLEGWQRTATSMESFNKMSLEQRGGFTNYDDFIRHKTQGMMDNGILQFLMTSGGWDPTGEMLASVSIKEASANVAREALWRGDRKTFGDKADAIARLFLDEDNKISYNKRDYGMFNLNGTSAALAALTRNMDFASDGNIEKATKDLQTRLQNLMKAMSPLKDFFGDDVPNMLRFLEEVTGKNIQQLDSATISSMSRRITAAVSTGSYTLDQYQKLSTQLQNSYAQMGAPYYLETSAGATADFILTAMNSGNIPLMMTKSSYTQKAADRTMRHAASTFAHNINLTYSVWEANMRRNNEKYQTLDAGELQDLQTRFMTEFNALREGGMDEEAAMKEMAKVNDMTQLEYLGTRQSGYARATAAGIGMLAAARESIMERSENIIMGQLDPKSQKGFRMLFNELMKNDESPEAKLRKIMEGEITGTEDQQLMAQALISLQSDKGWEDTWVDIQSYMDNNWAEGKKQESAKLQRNVDALEKLFGAAMEHPESYGEALVNAAFNSGQGFSVAALKTAFKTMPEMLQLVEEHSGDIVEEDWNELGNILQTTVDAAAYAGKNGFEQTEEALKAGRAYLKNKIADPKRNAVLEAFSNNLEIAKTEAINNGINPNNVGMDERVQYAANAYLAAQSMSSSELRVWDKLREATGDRAILDYLAEAQSGYADKYDTFIDGRTAQEIIKGHNGRDDMSAAEYKRATLSLIMGADWEEKYGWNGAKYEGGRAGFEKAVAANLEAIQNEGRDAFTQRGIRNATISRAATSTPDLYNAAFDIENNYKEGTYNRYVEQVLIQGKSLESFLKNDQEIGLLTGEQKTLAEDRFKAHFAKMQELDLAGGITAEMSPMDAMAKLFKGGEVFTEMQSTLGNLGTAVNRLVDWLEKNPEPGGKPAGGEPE